MKTIIIWG